MTTKGIRGATTAYDNSEKAIKEVTIELLNSLICENNIRKEKISHVIFTLTEDLNAEFPAKIARKFLGWEDVAMLCLNEATIQNSIKMCIRVLIVLNCENDFTPKYVYLNGANTLRN